MAKRKLTIPQFLKRLKEAAKTYKFSIYNGKSIRAEYKSERACPLTVVLGVHWSRAVGLGLVTGKTEATIINAADGQKVFNGPYSQKLRTKMLRAVGL
jgi:hypothetical protein